MLSHSDAEWLKYARTSSSSRDLYPLIRPRKHSTGERITVPVYLRMYARAVVDLPLMHFASWTVGNTPPAVIGHKPGALIPYRSLQHEGGPFITPAQPMSPFGPDREPLFSDLEYS